MILCSVTDINDYAGKLDKLRSYICAVQFYKGMGVKYPPTLLSIYVLLVLGVSSMLKYVHGVSIFLCFLCLDGTMYVRAGICVPYS